MVVEKEYQDKVLPGIFLFGEPLAGKTEAELKDYFRLKNEKIGQRKTEFYFNDQGEKHWEVRPSSIEFRCDEKLITQILNQGRTGQRMKDLRALYRLVVFPQEIKPEFAYSREKLEGFVSAVSAEIDRPVQDALFEFRGGKVVTFQVSKEGRSLKREEIKSLIILAFSQMPGKETVALELPVEKLVPKITTAESNRLGIKELLGEGESFFNDSIPTRIHNIALAASYLHGVVITPGETFSFSAKVGAITAETGYQQAYVIKEKKTILEDGGGVCQVSTTMFRAALNAGLPIVERHPHYYRVGFYEQGGYPPGLDAAVYPPSPDFKFLNDTPSYLLIQTEIDQSRKRLAFKIFGTADGRKIELQKPVIHSQTPPPEPTYIDDPTLPAGVIKRTDQAHWGAKVSVKRRVIKADGTTKEDKEFWSTYVPWPAVYQRGTGQ